MVQDIIQGDLGDPGDLVITDYDTQHFAGKLIHKIWKLANKCPQIKQQFTKYNLVLYQYIICDRIRQNEFEVT